MDKRLTAVAVGALGGAYTTDIFENPIPGIVNAGIGAAIGSMVILPEVDMRKLASVVTGVKQDEESILDRARSGISKQEERLRSSFTNNVSKFVDDYSIFSEGNGLENGFKEPLDNVIKNAKSIETILKARGYNNVPSLVEDPAQFSDFLRGLNNKNDISSIMPLFTSESIDVVNTNAVNAPKVQQFNAKIDGQLSQEDKIKKLAGILETQFGHTGDRVEDALEKASMFVKRSVGDIKVVDGSIILNDIADSKSITVPLTSYDVNGVRYHNAGNGRAMAVKGFSPFASMYMNEGVSSYAYDFDDGRRLVQLSDVEKGMDPEMMMKFLPDKAPINTYVGNMKKLISYDAAEAAHEAISGSNFAITSPQIKNLATITSLEYQLNIDSQGNINSARPLITPSSYLQKEGGGSAVADIMINKLAVDNKRAHKYGLGTSGNKSLDIQTSPNKTTIGMFVPKTRNPSGSVLRDTIPVKKGLGMEALETLYGNVVKESYSSAQVVTKLDIIDTKSFNDFATALTGQNQTILADGFGLFNKGHSEAFSIKTSAELAIPLDNRTLLLNGDLKEALQAQDLNAFLKEKGGIQIGTDILGYDANGRSFQLGKQFSEGVIKSGRRDNNGRLLLAVDAVFNPQSEESLKFFSVGSKSLAEGIEQSRFNITASVGALMNEGFVNYDNNLLTATPTAPQALKDVLGEGLGLQDIRRLDQNRGFDIFMRRDISLITEASKTGMSDLNHLLTSTPEDEVFQDFVKAHNISKLLTENPAQKRSIVTAAFLMQENKANEDITSAVATRLLKPLQELKKQTTGSKDYRAIVNLMDAGIIPKTKTFTPELVDQAIEGVTSAWRSAISINKYYKGDRLAQMQDLTKLVALSGIDTDLRGGISSTIGTVNKGRANVGTGNKASMSWVARTSMLNSGFTREQLNLFGKVDDGLLYEVNSLQRETAFQSKSVNSFIKGRERELGSILMNTSPEQRLNRLNNAFAYDSKNPYLSYNLNYTDHDIKSINFSLISTTRSGKFDFKDRELIKELESKRIDLLNLDVAWSKASGKERDRLGKELKVSLDNYTTYRSSMLSGDNSLMKGVLKLYNESSGIYEVKPVGGRAEKLFTKTELNSDGSYKGISDKVVMSRGGVNEWASRLGIKTKDIKLLDTEELGKSDSTIKRVMYRDADNKLVPLSLIASREPAQGTMSSQLLDVVLDTTIRGNDNALFFPRGSAAWAIMMGGDHDQDQAAVLGNKHSRAEYNELKATADETRARNTPLLNDSLLMSPKGSVKTTTTVNQFNSLEEFSEHQAKSAMQGTIRKDISPMATEFKINLSEAVKKRFYGDTDLITEAENALYRSVEGLLKTSHINTEEFDGTMAIQKLDYARRQYVEGVYDNSKYEKVLREHMPSILGYDETKPNAEKVSNIVDNLVTAELDQAKRINREAFTPTQINKGSKSATQTNTNLGNILKAQDIVDVEEGLDIVKSPKQLYHGVTDGMMDTLKRNKSLIGAGVAAMAGVALLSREQPTFSDSRDNVRMHNAQMLQQRIDPESVETGIETNVNRSGYVQPKSYNNKAVRMSGNFVEQGYNNYEQFPSEMMDYTDSQVQSLQTAVFGNDIRNSRLNITDL